MEKDISNSIINFYYSGIEFDANGVAMITCEQTSEAIVSVDCWPDQV